MNDEKKINKDEAENSPSLQGQKNDPESSELLKIKEDELTDEQMDNEKKFHEAQTERD